MLLYLFITNTNDMWFIIITSYFTAVPSFKNYIGLITCQLPVVVFVKENYTFSLCFIFNAHPTGILKYSFKTFNLKHINQYKYASIFLESLDKIHFFFMSIKNVPMKTGPARLDP